MLALALLMGACGAARDGEAAGRRQATMASTVPPSTARAATAIPADPGDLYALDLAAGTISRLTSDPRIDGAPAWMPDGGRILFGRLVSGSDPSTGNADIFVMRADGSSEQQLTDDPASDITPRSSPDGESVVFTTTRDRNPEIYVMALTTGVVRRLTTNLAGDGFPSFSPDGSRIVFTSRRDGDDDLYTIDLDGGDLRRLTDTPGTDSLAEFSPDGTTIAFATEHSIELIDTDGTNRRTLTTDAANHPSWSPDGSRIAAVTSTANGQFAICIIDVATGGLRTVTDGVASDFYPAWSPDGRQIVFARSGQGA
jgi:TolB protein